MSENMKHDGEVTPEEAAAIKESVGVDADASWKDAADAAINGESGNPGAPSSEEVVAIKKSMGLDAGASWRDAAEAAINGEFEPRRSPKSMDDVTGDDDMKQAA